MKYRTLGMLVLAIFIGACVSEVALKGGKYSFNLEECNRAAKTLCESVACENTWRGIRGRMPRTIPPHCSNASIEAGITDAGDKQ